VAGGPRRTPRSRPRSHPPHSNQQRAHLGLQHLQRHEARCVGHAGHACARPVGERPAGQQPVGEPAAGEQPPVAEVDAPSSPGIECQAAT
jgi:hypothetical protein